MANPLKGETDLRLDGVDYVICLTAHEIVQIERMHDIGIAEIGTWFQPQNLRLWRMQALLWASLRRHHKEITIDQALDLMAKPANQQIVVQKLIEAVNMSFPAPSEDTEENPPKASG
jgi:hypothetical protein